MPDPASLIRPSIRALDAYRVATQSEAAAKLDQNESPFDVPEEIKHAAIERLRTMDWNRYPADRPYRLVEALAGRLGVPADGVIVGRGSNEIAHTLGLALLTPGTPVVLPRPMFALYRSVAQMHDARLIEVGPEPDLTHDPEAVLQAAVEAEAPLTIVTTPNNPTGQLLSHDGLRRLAEGVPGLLVIDEAYHEFTEGPSATDLLAQHENVLVMRTFSKAMGLAGIRLGVLLGSPAVIQEIEKARLPFLVDRFSEEVGLLLLERQDLIQTRVRELLAERERLERALGELEGVEVCPGTANFFLMRTPLPVKVLRARLAEDGVFIRDMTGYSDLAAAKGRPGWARISAGTPEETDRLLDVLPRVLSSAVAAGR